MKKSIKQKQSLCKSKGKVYNKQTGRCKDTITTKRSRCKSKGKVYDRSKGRCKVSVTTKRSRCRSKGQVYNKDNGRCKVSVSTKRSRCKSKGKMYDVKSGKCWSKSKSRSKSKGKTRGKSKSKTRGKSKSKSRGKGKSKSKSRGKSKSKYKTIDKNKPITNIVCRNNGVNSPKPSPNSPYSWKYDNRFEFKESKYWNKTYGTWQRSCVLNKNYKYHNLFWSEEIQKYYGTGWTRKNGMEPNIKDMPWDLFTDMYVGSLRRYLERHFDEIRDNCQKVNEMLNIHIEYELNWRLYYIRTKNYDEANHMMEALVNPFYNLTVPQIKKLLIWLHPDKCPGSDKYKQNINLIQNAIKSKKPEFEDRMYEIDYNLVNNYGMNSIIPPQF